MAFPVGGYADVAAAIADNVIHHWPMEGAVEGTLEDVVDSGSLAMAFTVSPSTNTVVAGKFGNGRDVVGPGAGAAGANIVGTASTLGWPATDGALSLWFKPHNVPANDQWFTIMLFGSAVAIYYYRTAGGVDSMYISCSGSPDLDFAFAPSLVDYTNVVFSYDDATAVVTVYVNGTSQGTMSGCNFGVYASTKRLGSFNNTDADRFQGILDDFTIWDRALTAGEVTEIWNGGTGTAIIAPAATIFYADATAAAADSMDHYWQFEGANPSEIPDLVNDGPTTRSFSVTNVTNAYPAGLFDNAWNVEGPGTGLSRSFASSESTAGAVSRDSSLSIWVKPSAALVKYSDYFKNHTIFRVRNAASHTSGNLGVQVLIGIQESDPYLEIASSGTNALNYQDPITYSAGAWLHILITTEITDVPSDTSTMIVYVNGVAQTTTPTGVAGAGLDLYSGQIALMSFDDASTSGYMPGLIDDVGYWSRTLTPAEVTQIYNAGAGLQILPTPAAVPQFFEVVTDTLNVSEVISEIKFPTLNFETLSDTVNFSDTTIYDAPVGAGFPSGGYTTRALARADGLYHYWPMDNADKGFMLDLADQGLETRNIRVSPYVGTSVAGIQGTGVDIQAPVGTLGIPVYAVHHLGGTGLQLDSFTVAIWVRRTSVGEGSPMRIGTDFIDYYDAGGGSYFQAAGVNAAYVEVAGSLPLNTWTLLAMTGTASGTFRFWRDGAEIGSTAMGVNDKLDIDSATSPNLRFGHYSNGGSFFPGQLDEAAIWNRELNATEMGFLYNAGAGVKIIPDAEITPGAHTGLYADNTAAIAAGVIHYWPMDEDSGTLVDDTVAAGPVARPLTIGAELNTITSGIRANGRDLTQAATGQTTITGAAVSADPALTTYSLSMWAKPLTMRNNGLDQEFVFRNGSGVYVSLRRDEVRAAGGGALHNIFMGAVDTGVWLHVAMAVEAGVSKKVWLDGVLVANTSSASGSFPIYDTLVGIGHDDDVFGYTFPFQGTVDDFAVWNTAITQTEVDLIYNGGTFKPVITLFVAATFDNALSANLSMTEATQQGIGKTVDDTSLQFVETLEAMYGATMTEILRVIDTAQSRANMSAEILDEINFAMLIRISVEEALSEVLNFADTATLLLRIRRKLQAQLLIEGLANASAFYRMETSDTIEFLQDIFNGFGADLAEVLEFTEALTQRVEVGHLISAQLALTENISSPGMSIFQVTTDEITMGDSLSTRATLFDALADGLELVVSFEDGRDQYLGFTVNTANKAVSTYTSFDYNSFHKHRGRYLAASSTGIYELAGTTDDGELIQWRLKSGRVDPNDQQLTRVVEAFIGVRTSGTIVFKLITADSQEYWYETEATKEDIGNARVKFGKGLRVRYWQFELASKNGEAVEIDDIEFTALRLTRRV